MSARIGCTQGGDTQVSPYAFARIGCALALRGDTQVSPYVFNVNWVGDGGIDNDDPVKMVGHDDKRAQCDLRKFVGQFIPPFDDHLPRVVQYHFAVFDVAE
ncbi:MAG: hypothetical protein QY324_16135 [Anaerolineales bacterium]|nr:MAG: hypothetical protein QY324_16135 [Anaerolineales bacterium]